MIIHLDAVTPQEEAIEKASAVLLDGGVVACPTESFYGLAVDAGNETAIQKLFSLKERERRNPILLLIPSVESLTECVASVPPPASRLIREFWPGGLTLIFNASEKISPLLTGGAGKIGLRLSSHPVPTSLARALQRPITGTSANPSGRPPCRRSEEVTAYFGDRIDLIIDGGQTHGGLGSTVLDVTCDPPGVVREGMITRYRLEEFDAQRHMKHSPDRKALP